VCIATIEGAFAVVQYPKCQPSTILMSCGRERLGKQFLSLLL